MGGPSLCMSGAARRQGIIRASNSSFSFGSKCASLLSGAAERNCLLTTIISVLNAIYT